MKHSDHLAALSREMRGRGDDVGSEDVPEEAPNEDVDGGGATGSDDGGGVAATGKKRRGRPRKAVSDTPGPEALTGAVGPVEAGGPGSGDDGADGADGGGPGGEATGPAGENNAE